MQSKRFWWSLTVAFVLALSIACGSKDDEDEAAEAELEAASAGPVYTPTGNEGSIKGVVEFTGAAPAPRKVQMDSDPVCSQKNPSATTEDVIVTDGKLANVFVYVKSGLPRATFKGSDAPVKLDQVGCQYVPHVLGLQTGQALTIVNSDDTNHNIHPTPKNNREWNESQPPSAPPITKKFTAEEVLIPVKCNQHSWMKAWVGVLKHPFFAISDKSGAFAIAGLPPGDYEVEAWHEKFGAKTTRLKVTDKGEVEAKFTFDGATAYRSGSLKVQPALVLP